MISVRLTSWGGPLVSLTMSIRQHPSISVPAGALFAVLMTILVIGAPVRALAIAAASAFVLLILLASASTLRACAAVLFLTVPLAFMAVPAPIGKYLTPALILLVASAAKQWRGNKASTDRHLQAHAISALWLLPLLIVMALSWFVGMRPHNGGLFVVSTCVSVWLMIESARKVNGSDTRLRTTVAITTGLLVVYGLIEFRFQLNPLARIYYSLGPLSEGAGDFSVYRIRTLLGHPLVNSVVFSTVSVFFLFSGILQKSWKMLILSVASCAALVLTVSRGGVTGYVIATIAGTLFILFSARVGTSQKVLCGCLALLGSAAISFSPLLAARSSSSEGASSYTYRVQTFLYAWRLGQERRFLGYGPGGAENVFARVGISTPVESSIIQLILGVGLVGLSVWVLTLIGICWILVHRGLLASAASLICLLVSMATFNALESFPALLALGALMILADKPLRAEILIDQQNSGRCVATHKLRVQGQA